MVNVNLHDNFYEYRNRSEDSKVIIYGAGKCGKNNYYNLGKIDFFCDKNARRIKSIGGIKCILPEELKNISNSNPLLILVCVEERDLFEVICEELKSLEIDGEVFFLYENPAFSLFNGLEYRYNPTLREPLKICIVYQEDGWILGKFASKLKEELIRLGQEVELSCRENPDADINHYIPYIRLDRFLIENKKLRTTMITHIDTRAKKDLLLYQLQHDVVGICMSSETQKKLICGGLPEEKLCYINPAHDGDLKPRKIVLGITNRCYSDNVDFRKRDDLLVEVARELDRDFFLFKIMGAGWEKNVEKIRTMGFEVNYYPEFHKETYRALIQSLDYWIFYGFDEGGMGFLDAVAAGVKTIATPQGFHLDAEGGLTYPCKTIDDFKRTLLGIEREKKEISKIVSLLTWENYAKKHLELWQYLLKSKELKYLYSHQSEYVDGIFSLLMSNNSIN